MADDICADQERVNREQMARFNEEHRMDVSRSADRRILEEYRALGIDPGVQVQYRRLSDVQPEPIRWLWPGRIAKGKPTVIAGDPGLGKSQITASMAAIATTGGLWPVDRTRAEPGNVVILSAEDDAADTIRPRLEAAGADVSRCFVIDSVVDDERERHFSLARDIGRLGEMANTIGDVAMVVIDPISAYLGGTDSHKNSDIRELLAPLGRLAAEQGAAFILVSHLNKSGGQNALSRVTGSLAFVAAARAAYIVSRDPDDDTRRLFLPAKNNIGPDSTGLAFHIESATVGEIETSRISWHPEPVDLSADDAVTPSEDRSATDEAREFLEHLLRGGGMAAKDVKKEAREAGISDKALRRARERLGIRPTKSGFSGGWRWALPAKMPEGAQSQDGASWGTLGTEGHLGDDTYTPGEDRE